MVDEVINGVERCKEIWELIGGHGKMKRVHITQSQSD